MLSVSNLSLQFGKRVLFDEVNVKFVNGNCYGVIGANGAGKSSTLMCVAGHVLQQGGALRLDGQNISAWSPTERVRKGIAISPEGRRLFIDLTVQDNLRVGGMVQSADVFTHDRDRVLELFPRLGERLHSLACNLSGGEQQMLAIGRALMTRPRVIMIDELSLGLMPKVIDLCYQALLKLREEGMTIFLVEQNTERVLQVADEICVLESGNTVWRGSAADARSNPQLTEAYLGMH